jgi:hypothetical protein
MLERTNTRSFDQQQAHFVRPSESVSVNADVVTGGESKPITPSAIHSDDLDIPTFLRNRR